MEHLTLESAAGNGHRHGVKNRSTVLKHYITRSPVNGSINSNVCAVRVVTLASKVLARTLRHDFRWRLGVRRKARLFTTRPSTPKFCPSRSSKTTLQASMRGNYK